MLSVVGDDWRGQYLLEEFQREGVATSQILQQPNSKSFAASIMVRKRDGARAITYVPGSGPELVLTESHRAVLQQTSILHLNGRYFSACLEATQWIHQCGGQVSFDGGADRYQPEFRQLVPMTDICIVARDFAEQYTTTTDLERAAATLLREGPKLVVITDGTKGSWIFVNDGTQFQQPAYLVPDVVDTTGCGDSYHGAFLFGLIKGMHLRDCARLASAVAALNSRQLGGRSGLPNLAQVKAFLS
jgi:sugar/nucleoside kinase (ribokinase family)